MRTWRKMALCAALTLAPVMARAEKRPDADENAAGKRTTTLSDSGDRKFIEEAAAGGMAEVRLGQLAAERASSPEVKQFGQRMVQDHSKANDELKSIADQKNQPLPTEMTSADQKTYQQLAQLSGADFDKQYMKHMVKDHDHDVRAFKKEASASGADPDLQAFAKRTLPVLEEHDHLAKQTSKGLK